jgi:hypothetical protein
MSGIFGSKTQALAFGVVFGVLALAATGLNVTTRAMSLYFKKEPVPLARALETLPLQFGPWLQVSKDTPLPPDIEEALATKEYVFRDYVDTRQLSAFELQTLRSAPEQVSKEEAARGVRSKREVVERIRFDHPTAVLNMAVTYYTGMVDTVAHIPDRCYIADGFQPTTYEQPIWDAGKYADGKERRVPVRFINFEDQTGARSSIPRSVSYLFHVNGQYECDPIKVRIALQGLQERYAYYSKVELMMLTQDQEAAAKTKADFLSYALPEIEKSWPNWQKIKEQGVVTAEAK